ncbi:hypothetical protein ACE6H2_011767 [Prunus campanulata]
MLSSTQSKSFLWNSSSFNICFVFGMFLFHFSQSLTCASLTNLFIWLNILLVGN